MPRKLAKRAMTIASLGPPLKVSGSGWTNYYCPICRDTKRAHFWVAPDSKFGHCFKCGGKVHLLAHSRTLPLDYLARDAARLLDNKQPSPTPALTLEQSELGDSWTVLSWYQLNASTKIAGLVDQYIQSRHVKRGSLEKIGASVLTRELRGKVGLFFSSSVAGVGYLRILKSNYEKPGWKHIGPVSQMGLYKGALALLREPQRKRSALFLVESVMDAVCLGEHQLAVYALGGTNITSRDLQDILSDPHENIVILLDSDATDKALKIKGKIEVACPAKTVQIVHIPHDPITGTTRDPCDLSDEELDELL